MSKPKFPLGSRPLGFGSVAPTDPGDELFEVEEDEASRNCRTILSATADRIHVPPVGTLRAFEAVHPELMRVAGRVSGVLVGIVGPAGTLVGHAAVSPDHSLIIGRHTKCHLRLEDRSLSLRHLAVHIEPGPDGVRTRLWDLQTETSFRTEDGASASAVVADGPLFVTLGQYTIVLLPTLPACPADLDEAWSALPPRDFQNLKTADVPRSPPSEEAAPVGASSDSYSGRSISRITRVPHATALSNHSVPIDLLFARISIVVKARTLVHDVSLEDLRRGVLIGRYERCRAGRYCDDSVSRVHLLIVAIGDVIYAIDTASSNGTELAGSKVHTAQLGSWEELLLANITIVRWQAIARAVA